jgi:putative membrane protein insertion efficiency factor
VVAVLVALLRAYQLLLSPLLGPVCRYAPSCSSYAVRALQVHGPLTGTWLAARRVARCHPWAAGGWDPVPPPGPRRSAHTGHEHAAPHDDTAAQHDAHRPEPARTR